MRSDASRLEVLETRLAFQEDSLQQLNDALIAQQARIDHLEAMLRLLVEQLGNPADDGGMAPEPPPPHY